LVVGYTFDLRTNELQADRIPNPRAGTGHPFVAYRLVGQSSKPVSFFQSTPLPNENLWMDEE
jgi:hypothetical protein